MKFSRELAERFLDLVRTRGARHAEALVIIFVLNGHRERICPSAAICQSRMTGIKRWGETPGEPFLTESHGLQNGSRGSPAPPKDGFFSRACGFPPQGTPGR